MDIKTFTLLFETGDLVAARVVPSAAEPNSWGIVVERKSGESELMTLARTTKEKVYKLRETAINEAFSIGFKEIIVMR